MMGEKQLDTVRNDCLYLEMYSGVYNGRGRPAFSLKLNFQKINRLILQYKIDLLDANPGRRSI